MLSIRFLSRRWLTFYHLSPQNHDICWMDQVDVLLKGWWQKSVWKRRKVQSDLITAIQPSFPPTFRLPLIWRPREKTVERRVIIVSKSLFNRRLNVVNIFIEARQTEIQVWGKLETLFCFYPFQLTAVLNIYNFVQKLYLARESTDMTIISWARGGAIRKSPGAHRKIITKPLFLWRRTNLGVAQALSERRQTPTQYLTCICLAVFICFFVCYVFHINTRNFSTQNPLP